MIKARKCPQSKNIDLRLFCEKTPFFYSLFLVNLLFSLGIFLLCFEIFHVRLYIVENGSLERLSNDVEFILNLIFNAENLSFIALWNLSCGHKSVPTYACIRIAYAYVCMRTQAKGFLGLYLPKIDLFAHKKLYFPF